MADPVGRFGSSIFYSQSITGGQTTVTFGYQGPGRIVPSVAVIYELTPCTADNNNSVSVTPGASETGATIAESANAAYFEVIQQNAGGSPNYSSVSSPWVLDYVNTALPAGNGMGSSVYILNSTGSQTPTWSVTGGGTKCGVCGIGLLDSSVPISLVQLTGGSYQDMFGNPIALGYLKMKLTNPMEVYTVGDEIIEGNDISFTIKLDANGNCVSGQFVYSTSVLTPTTTYTVQAYAADGARAGAPQTVTVPNTSSSYSISNWVPDWPTIN